MTLTRRFSNFAFIVLVGASLSIFFWLQFAGDPKREAVAVFIAAFHMPGSAWLYSMYMTRKLGYPAKEIRLPGKVRRMFENLYRPFAYQPTQKTTAEDIRQQLPVANLQPIDPAQLKPQKATVSLTYQETAQLVRLLESEYPKKDSRGVPIKLTHRLMKQYGFKADKRRKFILDEIVVKKKGYEVTISGSKTTVCLRRAKANKIIEDYYTRGVEVKNEAYNE